MGTKLYVGNLNYNTNEESLRLMFSSNGRQVAKVSLVIDRETGRSRGFAFVEMATAEDAASAMQELEGADLDGRALRINEARERDPNAPRPPPRAFGGGAPGGGGGGFGAPRPPSSGGFGAPRPAGGGFGGPPSGGFRDAGGPRGGDKKPRGGGRPKPEDDRRGGGGGKRRGHEDDGEW